MSLPAAKSSFPRNPVSWLPHAALTLIIAAITACQSTPEKTQLTPSLSLPASGTARLCLEKTLQPSCFYKQDSGVRHTKLLVFVHGVFGSSASTWGDPSGDHFWPEMVSTDPRFGDFDIYLMNYLTPIIGSAPNINEIGGNELSQLRDKGIFQQYTDVHFLAHSMGGLVVKSMLTQLNRGEDLPLLRRIKSAVFLSTPAQGAELAGIGSWLTLNRQLNNMQKSSLNAFIQRLDDDWTRLIEDRDKAEVRFPRASCAFETKPTSMEGWCFLICPAVWVVPREMANSRCDGVLHPMPFDHHGVVIATQRDVDPYLWAMTRIQEVNHETELKAKADTLMEQARSFMRSKEFENARNAFEEARRHYEAIHDRGGGANILRGLGDIARELGRVNDARWGYLQALSLFQNVKHRKGEAEVLEGLGHLETPLDPELAKQYFYQAAYAYQELKESYLSQRASEAARALRSQEMTVTIEPKKFAPLPSIQ